MRSALTAPSFTAALLLCGFAHAQDVQVTDITNEVVDHLKQHYVGASVDMDYTTIRKTSTYRDRAKGSAKITEYLSHEGTIKRIQVEGITVYKADFKVKFRYESQTRCERFNRQTGARIDVPWGDLHPKGTITAHLRIQTQAELKGETFVEPGHPDRPNDFVKEHLIKNRLANRLKELIGDKLNLDLSVQWQ